MYEIVDKREHVNKKVQTRFNYECAHVTCGLFYEN
jgi:hypothetical protein